MDVTENLKRLGLTLPPPIPAQGVYTPVVPFGDKLLYGSGMGPNQALLPHYEGRLGREFDIAQGQAAARQAVLNILANLQQAVGDLGRVRRFVKILVFVSSTEDFYDQPAVADGASALLRELFGPEAGLPARSAIGVNVLPGNIPVEIEWLAELKPE